MRFYIGFDIGDAESILAFILSTDGAVQPATMPGKNASGQAIPTLYGYDNDGNLVFADEVAADYENLKSVEMNFKRRPSDILTLSTQREGELFTLDKRQLLNEPEFQAGAIREYITKLTTFINIVLRNPKFVERARAFAVGCDDCVVCVGHPTKWNNFDKLVYESILLNSVLGEETYIDLPLELKLECESRAAFLYIKNTYCVKLEDNEYVALMDVGSSTIDVSVLTKSSRDCVYDSGHNFLGARLIDYLILEYYIEKLTAKDPDDGALLKEILQKNHAAFRSLLLNCRIAKEKIFSATAENKANISAKIIFGEFMIVKLDYKTLTEDLCNRPIAPILKRYCDFPAVQADALGNDGWIPTFIKFVKEQLALMEQVGIKVNKMFLTGSASQMDFIRSVCKEMIPALADKNSLFDDTNPSNAIANGLARVGTSDDKAEEFEKDMEIFLNTEMPPIIKRRIPDLIQGISSPIVGILQNKVLIPAIKDWKQKKYKTLNDMMNDIKKKCNDHDYMNSLMENDEDFKNAVTNWMVNQLGNDIAVSLQAIATKHKVFDFNSNQLNAFKPNISVGDDSIDMSSINIEKYTPMNEIAAVIAVVIAVVGYVVLPYIISAVLTVVWVLFESLAISILTALMALPGGVFVAGLAAIAALLAGGVYMGYKNNKKEINAWLLQQDLPGLVRDKVSVDEFLKQVKQNTEDLPSKIAADMNKKETIANISQSIYAQIKPQVEARADQIKFEIVNR